MKYMPKFCCQIGYCKLLRVCLWALNSFVFGYIQRRGVGLFLGFHLKIGLPTWMCKMRTKNQWITFTKFFLDFSLSLKGTAKKCDNCEMAEAIHQQFCSPCDVCKGQGEFFSGMWYVCMYILELSQYINMYQYIAKQCSAIQFNTLRHNYCVGQLHCSVLCVLCEPNWITGMWTLTFL